MQLNTSNSFQFARMIHGEVKTNPEYISQGWVFYMFSMIRLRSESYYMTRICQGLQHVSETAIHTWTALYNLVILPRSVAQTMQGRILKQTPCITQQTTAFLSIVFCYSLHDTSQTGWIWIQHAYVMHFSLSIKCDIHGISLVKKFYQ